MRHNMDDINTEIFVKTEPIEYIDINSDETDLDKFINEEPYKFSDLQTEFISFKAEPNCDPLLTNQFDVFAVREKKRSECKQLPVVSGESGGRIKVFKCVLCDFVGRESATVDSHALQKHSMSYFCRKCKQKFNSKSQMFAHELKESCVEKEYFTQMFQCVFCDTIDEKLSFNCDVSCQTVMKDNTIARTCDKPVALPLPPKETKSELNSTVTLIINGSFEYSDFTFTAPTADESNRRVETLEIDEQSNSCENNEENSSNVQTDLRASKEEVAALMRAKYNASFIGKDVVVFPRIYCRTCERNFDVNFYIQSHVEEETNFLCQCPFCRKLPSNCVKKQFLHHIRDHCLGYVVGRLFHCPLRQCNFTFFSRQNLQDHKATCETTRELGEKPVENILELSVSKNYYYAVNFVRNKLLSEKYPGKDTILHTTIFCEDCNIDYDVNMYIFRHILQRKQSFITCPCFICGWKVKDANVNDFLFHLQSHLIDTPYGKRMFCCNYPNCSAAFFTTANQKKHERVIHNMNQYIKQQLHEQEMITFIREMCNAHRTETNVTPQIYCCTCKRNFNVHFYILSHLEEDTNFSCLCPFCPIPSYYIKTQFIQHIREHFPGKKQLFYCTLYPCNYAFFSQVNLDHHKTTCLESRDKLEKPVVNVLELNILTNYYAAVNFVRNKLSQTYRGKNTKNIILYTALSQKYPGKSQISYTTIFCNECKTDYDVNMYICRHILQRKQSFITCSCFFCGWKAEGANVNDFLFHLQIHLIYTNYKRRMFHCNLPHCSATFFTSANRRNHSDTVHSIVSPSKVVDGRPVSNNNSSVNNTETSTLSQYFNNREFFNSLQSTTDFVMNKLKQFKELHSFGSFSSSMMIFCTHCSEDVYFLTFIKDHVNKKHHFLCPFCNCSCNMRLRKEWNEHFSRKHYIYSKSYDFCYECNYLFYNSYNFAAHSKRKHCISGSDNESRAKKAKN